MDGLNQKTMAEMLRSHDLTAIAIDVMHRLDSMQPFEVPRVPMPSAQLQKLFDLRPPCSVPDDLRFEHDEFSNARLRRANAKGENERRLRSLLWSEQYLRSQKRQEHQLIRDFNREVWGVNESASRDVAEREAQVKAHA